MRTSRVWIALVALVIALACCPSLSFTLDPDSFPGIVIDTGDSGPEPTVEISREPASDVATETEQLLAGTVVPVRDLHELAIRLQGLPADTPREVQAAPPDYDVGDTRVFHVSNTDTDEQFDITAVMMYETDHLYMWVQQGMPADEASVREAAETFESHTYPTVRAFFGTEWSPGVDGDPHVHILHARGLGSVGGYYSSSDEFVSAVREDSNQMEMFYISLEYEVINSDSYHGTLAHEFQHMIHWYADRNEDTWLNEGFSVLSSYLAGFDPGGFEFGFASRPDTQLTDIDYDADDVFASYGAGYMFAAYFLDRFGAEATQALVAHPENGLAAVNAVLAELGAGVTAEDVFADWVVANLLDDPAIDDGRYGYAEMDPPEVWVTSTHTEFPASDETTVRQYGADYIEVQGSQPLQLSFTGATQSRLVNTTAHSGQYLWWSNRGDDSDMTLTREFDLSEVDSATLEFWTWYDIEEDWDYAYVEISTDGGATWQILTTPSCTAEDPNGNSFGCAYTGMSGDGGEPTWIQEQVDLTPYAGQTVQVRFEYITDDAVNRPGFVVDDLGIPEIDYFSDFEADGDGWETEGFVRHANVLNQRWLVQLILFGPQTTVQQLEVGADQTGQWEIPLGGGVGRAVVVVSGLAPVTTEPAAYRYDIALP